MNKRIILSLVSTIFLAFLFCPGCKNVTEPIEPDYAAAAGHSTRDIEQQIFRLVNSHRASQGLQTLVWDNSLAELGRSHSRNMAAGTVPFSHDGLTLRSSLIMKTHPFFKYSENVAYIHECPDPAGAVVNKWRLSPLHLSKMEGDFDSTGVGVEKSEDEIYYFTQIFIKEK